MGLVKQFLKNLLEEILQEFNNPNNNCEDSGEFGKSQCAKGQRYLMECNKCVCASGKSAMVVGALYEQKYLNGTCIEEKNCRDSICGDSRDASSTLVTKSCGSGTVTYKECLCKYTGGRCATLNDDGLCSDSRVYGVE